jgi:hypothetical protein
VAQIYTSIEFSKRFSQKNALIYWYFRAIPTFLAGYCPILHPYSSKKSFKSNYEEITRIPFTIFRRSVFHAIFDFLQPWYRLSDERKCPRTTQ